MADWEKIKKRLGITALFACAAANIIWWLSTGMRVPQTQWDFLLLVGSFGLFWLFFKEGPWSRR